MPKEAYKSGLIGFQSCPKVPFLSTIPEIVDMELYFEKLQLRGGQEDHKTNEETILAESTEKNVIEFVTNFFENHRKEDAFAFFRQHLNDLNGRFPPEKDVILINMTRGYILCIEARGTLRRNFKRRKTGKSRDVKDQIQETINILKHAFNYNLENEWKIITAVYATKIHDSFKSCEKCDAYVFTKKDIKEKLNKIMEEEPIKNGEGNYLKDFRFMVREILPLKVKITNKKLTDSFTMNRLMLETVTSNVSEAGTAENVAYWSVNQYNLASECLRYKRVILSSAWSTGKTALLIHCAHELLKIGEKVLFIINHRYDHFNEKLQTLLQLKLQMLFENEENIEIITKNVADIPEEAGKQIFSQYQDYNVLIDEVTYGIAVDCKRFIEWSEQIGTDKHFWIVCDIAEDTNIIELNELYNTNWLLPDFEYPLRNAREIIELVLTNKNAQSYDLYEHGCNFMESLQKLKKPDNLTQTFPVKVIQCENYKDGFEMALQSLKQFSDNHTEYAMFVCNWGYTNCKTCQCYQGEEPTNTEFANHVSKIFEKSGRSKPIVYRQETGVYRTLSGGAQAGHSGTQTFNEQELAKIEEVKNWIKASSTKTCDLITEYNQIQGFEHTIVVVFQDQDPTKYELNICMRATSYLIVIEMPQKQHTSLCFGACPKNDHGIERTDEVYLETWCDDPYDDIQQIGPFMIYRKPQDKPRSYVEDISELTKEQCDAHNASCLDLRERGKRVITQYKFMKDFWPWIQKEPFVDAEEGIAIREIPNWYDNNDDTLFSLY